MMGEFIVSWQRCWSVLILSDEPSSAMLLSVELCVESGEDDPGGLGSTSAPLQMSWLLWLIRGASHLWIRFGDVFTEALTRIDNSDIASHCN